MKHCNKCDIDKSLEMFSKDIRKKDGRSYICKSCHKNNENILKRRRRDLDSKKRLRNRCRAREMARKKYASPQHCAVMGCLKKATELHHVNYDLPFDVIPLCRRHHRMNHDLCKIE